MPLQALFWERDSLGNNNNKNWIMKMKNDTTTKI